jgi:hypothetical protein
MSGMKSRAERDYAQIWPPDMVIQVEHHDRFFNQLLYARFAWRISPESKLPIALSGEPRVGASRRPSFATLSQLNSDWVLAWQDRLARLPEKSAPSPTATDDVEAYWAVRNSLPSSWGELYEFDGFDSAAYGDWNTSVARAVLSQKPPDAESVCVRELTHAWSAGLRKVIVLPISASFSQWITDEILIVSKATRDSALDYSAVLAANCAGDSR